jgi:multidrug efflux pump subunit AcrA (membrane-fusion protein)
MNIISAWEAQTKELYNRVEQEIKDFQDDAEKRIASLQQRKWALEEALRAYQEMMGSELTQARYSLDQRDITDRSYREILNQIALHNGDLIIARQAIRLMKEANVFGNPFNADSVVYSVLNRSPEFVRVGKGVYKLNAGRGRPKISTKKDGGAGALRQAIQELKEKTPQMTKAEVLSTLIKKGFDFKGKRASSAVNMVWVKLGFTGKEIHEP